MKTKFKVLDSGKYAQVKRGKFIELVGGVLINSMAVEAYKTDTKDKILFIATKRDAAGNLSVLKNEDGGDCCAVVSAQEFVDKYSKRHNSTAALVHAFRECGITIG